MKTLFKLLLPAVLFLSLAACEEKGPLEKAGEAADETVEDAADAVKDATN